MTNKMDQLSQLNQAESIKRLVEESSEKQEIGSNNYCESKSEDKEQRTIDRVIDLLQEELNGIDYVIDELSEDSPVWSKFILHESCYVRLLNSALEEQKKLKEIWKKE